MADLVLRNARLVYADGALLEGGLVARDGVIFELFAGEGPAATAGCTDIDAEGGFVLPGAIDPHVQLYPAPGFAHYATETRSAAIGGVTTILKMHRDLEGYPADAFWDEIERAESRAHVDFAFHLAVMTAEQIAAIPDYAHELELTSFKLFTAYKGEEGFRLGIQGVDDSKLLEAFRAVAEIDGVALVHCENQELANSAYERVRASGRDGLRAYADSRPPIVEEEAIRRASFLAAVAGCALYVVHVTSKGGLTALVEARRDGGQLFIETESHYLTETCDSPAGNLAKVIPPIRTQEHREALWEAFAAGEVDAVGSDHVAASRERKHGSVWDAQLGFPGVATVLPALLSEGVNEGRISLADVAAATSTKPARIFGLTQKGELRPGKDADFVVVDLELEREVSASALQSAADFSIYEGRRLRGWPIVTVCRGEIVMRDGDIIGPEGHGRYIRRTVRAVVDAPVDPRL